MAYSLESMEGTTSIITGGLGFFGSNLAHKLVALGSNVEIFDVCLEPFGWNFNNIKEIKDKVKYVNADIRDFETLKKEVAGKDFVFHLAAHPGHAASITNPHLDIDVNCDGTINVLEACRIAADNAKVIFPSSRGVTGKSMYLPVDENHPANPLDIYGANKLACEKYMQIYHYIHGLKTSSIRITNPYGPRQSVKTAGRGAVTWFIRCALENKPLTIWGDGKQLRDYAYVEDIVDALILAAQKKQSEGELFQLGTEQRMQFVEMAKTIVRLVGKGEVTFHPWPELNKSIEIGDFVGSYQKLKKVLGWEPKTSFEEGIKKTIEFYKQRLPEYI
ncbi:NAD-dependent epimerase/dehydratase family protein [archaeon]|nr:MAG: NAD-dependent epimerase/dehydratase family protein [archaeon]